jgi:predicted metal-dependent hydrolase
LDHKLKQGIELFNSGNFFEAHEVWESYWNTLQTPEKTQLQALIQSAVALHLLTQGREIGAIKVWNRAISNFKKVKEPLFDILIEDLVEQMQNVFSDFSELKAQNVKIRLI